MLIFFYKPVFKIFVYKIQWKILHKRQDVYSRVHNITNAELVFYMVCCIWRRIQSHSVGQLNTYVFS